MSDTKFEYKNNKGFWISTSFAQLALHYIYTELEKPQYNVTNKSDMLEKMSYDLNGYVEPGFTWRGHITNPTEEQTLIQVLQNVKTTLQNKGAFISVDEMQAIPTEDRMFKWLYSEKPFPTGDLIKIIDALIQMLEGTWEPTNFDMDAEINWKYED
jgi:hypothetical protein